MSRRDIQLELGDIQAWRQREEAERRTGGSRLKWLWLNNHPRPKVNHKVRREQLVDNMRQLKL